MRCRTFRDIVAYGALQILAIRDKCLVLMSYSSLPRIGSMSSSLFVTLTTTLGTEMALPVVCALTLAQQSEVTRYRLFQRICATCLIV